jgi:uncharacterized protein (DUF433 family)
MNKSAVAVKKQERFESPSRISRSKRVMHGQPVIRGTRIPVSMVFDYIADGYSTKDLLHLFPHLTPEDVQAALRYGSRLLQNL